MQAQAEIDLIYLTDVKNEMNIGLTRGLRRFVLD